MSKAQQPDERYLKNALQQADSTEEVACKYGVGTALGLEAHIAAKTIRAQHAHIAEMEATHLRELAAYRTTAENLEAERSAIIAEKNDYKISLRAARAELAALKAAPAAQAVEPAAGAAQSGTVTYSDGTTATGPGSLPQVSPRQQRAAALIDSVEALLGGANGPTIQLRALLAAPAPAAVAVPDASAASVALKLAELDSVLLKDARQALWAIAQTYNDDELRVRAQERMEHIDEQRCVGRESIFNKAALAATPPAQALNLDCKSVQKRLATQWGFAPHAQDVQRYRLLKCGEMIAATDEFLQDDSNWEKDESGIWVGAQWSDLLRPARRAIAASAAQGEA